MGALYNIGKLQVVLMKPLPLSIGHSGSSRLIHQPVHAPRRGLFVRAKRFSLGRDEAEAETNRGHRDGVPQKSRGETNSGSGIKTF